MVDLSALKGVPGQKNWYSLWTQNIDYLQSVTTEVTTARQGQANLNTKITAMDNATTAVTNEVTTARQGQANLNASIDLRVPKSGFTAHFSANHYRINTLADAVSPLDAVNLQQVTSLIQGGGSPSNIQITSLNVGTGNARELFRVNDQGMAIEGAVLSELAAIEMTYLFEFYGRM